MSRLKKMRPSPSLAVAVAAMVVAVAGVAVAGPVANQSKSPSKKQVKNIARNIAGQEIAAKALSKTAVRTATVAANGNLVRGSGITQANVLRQATGTYCIRGLTPAPKDAVMALDFSETGFKSQEYVSVGGGGGCPTGTQVWIDTRNDANALADARFHVAIFSD